MVVKLLRPPVLSDLFAVAFAWSILLGTVLLVELLVGEDENEDRELLAEGVAILETEEKLLLPPVENEPFALANTEPDWKSNKHKQSSPVAIFLYRR